MPRRLRVRSDAREVPSRSGAGSPGDVFIAKGSTGELWAGLPLRVALVNRVITDSLFRMLTALFAAGIAPGLCCCVCLFRKMRCFLLSEAVVSSKPSSSLPRAQLRAVHPLHYLELGPDNTAHPLQSFNRTSSWARRRTGR